MAVTTGILCGFTVVPFAAVSASAVDSDACVSAEAITREATAMGSALPSELAAALLDGVLTSAEVTSAGYVVVCTGDTPSFALASPATTPPTPVPTETPTPAATIVPSPEASALGQGPAVATPRSANAARSTAAASAPASAAPASPAATPEPVAAAPAAVVPTPSASVVENDELRTLADSGVPAGDEDVETLADPSLTAARGALPGIGIIAGVSSVAALALGGVAALIGRTGGRRSPRHLR